MSGYKKKAKHVACKNKINRKLQRFVSFERSFERLIEPNIFSQFITNTDATNAALQNSSVVGSFDNQTLAVTPVVTSLRRNLASTSISSNLSMPSLIVLLVPP